MLMRDQIFFIELRNQRQAGQRSCRVSSQRHSLDRLAGVDYLQLRLGACHHIESLSCLKAGRYKRVIMGHHLRRCAKEKANVSCSFQTQFLSIMKLVGQRNEDLPATRELY